MTDIAWMIDEASFADPQEAAIEKLQQIRALLQHQAPPAAATPDLAATRNFTPGRFSKSLGCH